MAEQRSQTSARAKSSAPPDRGLDPSQQLDQGPGALRVPAPTPSGPSAEDPVESLSRAEGALRIASRVAKLGAWSLELPSNAHWWSLEARRIHGVDPSVESYPLDELFNFYHPEDRERIRQVSTACAEEGQSFDELARFITARGEHRWVRAIGEAVRDREGAIVRMHGAIQDVTEQKAAEEASYQRERELAALLHHARDAIVVRDLEHRVTFWNQSAEKLYGWAAADVLGQSVQWAYPDPKLFLAATERTLTEGSWAGEIEQVTKDGRAIVVEARWSLLRNDAGAPQSILAINTDISERRGLERQLLRAQRLESIGTLAGGIAHDLNNILAPILVSVQMLRDGETDPERLEDFASVESCAQRGAGIVRQLLGFARGLDGQRTRTDLGHVVREVVKVLQETLPKNIRIAVEVPEEPLELDTDATQIHQVLLNLCVNSRDAMPSGGTLQLALRTVFVDDVYAGLSPSAHPGPHAMLVVEDSGAGMPPEVRERIFEPFFTTKGLERGTGLGLSTSYAIVKAHGGFIQVYSELGRGSRFEVYLPAATSSAPAGAGDDKPAPLSRGAGQLVLVVDDEELIRKMVRRTLERFGYRVVTAQHGAEAVALCAQHGSELAVVLTDMAMPVMDGIATIVALRSLRPDLPIIGSSGREDPGLLTRARTSGMQAFLPKPYTAEQILAAIADALGGASASAGD